MKKETKKVTKGTITKVMEKTETSYKTECPSFAKYEKADGQCKACSKNSKRKVLHEACIEASKAIAVKKVMSAPINLGTDVFGFRISGDAHKFAMELVKASRTMKEVKNLSWNPRPNTFYCAFNSLVKMGYAQKDGKKLMLTPTGLELLKEKKAA